MFDKIAHKIPIAKHRHFAYKLLTSRGRGLISSDMLRSIINERGKKVSALLTHEKNVLQKLHRRKACKDTFVTNKINETD